LATDRQTNKQMDKHMDSSDALSRSRERQLNILFTPLYGKHHTVCAMTTPLCSITDMVSC